MFEVLQTKLTNKHVLTRPIDWSQDEFLTCQLSQFDREGYELLPIEQEYYKAENYLLHKENVLAHESGQGEAGWHAILNSWITQTEKHPNLYLDHSLVVHRLGFGGEALQQIEYYSKQRPELQKLIHTKTKWGHDFCLDWIDEDGVTEIIHWEWDFRSFEDYTNHRIQMEELVYNTDWISHSAKIIAKYKKEYNKTSEEVGDEKASEIGLPKAFRLFKTL